MASRGRGRGWRLESARRCVPGGEEAEKGRPASSLLPPSWRLLWGRGCLLRGFLPQAPAGGSTWPPSVRQPTRHTRPRPLRACSQSSPSLHLPQLPPPAGSRLRELPGSPTHRGLGSAPIGRTVLSFPQTPAPRPPFGPGTSGAGWGGGGGGGGGAQLSHHAWVIRQLPQRCL